MKSLALMIVAAVYSVATLSQSAFSNKVNGALEKVIKDYPNQFHNIKGDVIVQNPQTTQYKSTVVVPGAVSCTVTKYADPKDDSYTWVCVYQSEDFDQAKNKFKEIFGQIKNTIIKIDGEKPFILSGQYETPNETKKTTSVVFELLPPVGEMKKLKVDLNLQYVVNGWKVSLSVYDKDKKEDETATLSIR